MVPFAVKSSFAWLATALLLAAAPAARAQGVFDVGTLTNTLTIPTGTRASAGAAKAGRPASAASFAYAPTAALKASTVQGYVDRLRAKNPAASQAVAASFGPGKNDYGKIYQNLVKDGRMPENDAASALASYLILGWMITNNVQSATAITPELAAGVRQQIAAQLRQNPKLTAPDVPAQLGEEMKLQCVVVQGGWQSAIKENTLPAYRQGVAELFKNQYGLDFTKVKLTPQGFAGASGAAAPARHPAAAAAAGASAAATTAAPGSGVVAGAQWFFRAVSGAGAAVAFEPVVLLASGQYFDIGDEPLETLNAAAARAKRPDAWGSWRKNGAAFVLTDAKGHVNSYTLGSGNWFPAYPAGATPLMRAYEKVSGGQVGTATTLFISKIRFLNGTHFSQGENKGISSGPVYGGGTSRTSGTYRLQGHTLTLTYPDGRTVRKSFALGAEGSPAHPVSTLIFIGGDAYTDE